MVGTEKQINWAKEIKDTFLNGAVAGGVILTNGITAEIEAQKESAKKYAAKCERKGIDVSEHKGYNWAIEDVAKLEKLLSFVNSCDDAVWFIENKDATKSVLTFARNQF